jgi:hypothetical protein
MACRGRSKNIRPPGPMGWSGGRDNQGGMSGGKTGLNELLGGEASAVPESEAVSVTGVKPGVQRRRSTVP